MEHFRADDGEPIHYKSSGKGPALVLLHGWTSSHRDWNPFLEAFEAAHRVIRWDARGHGGHALQTRTAPTVARMARDLRQLIEYHDLQEVVAVGHSMGALTLWQYIRDFGCAQLSRLVLIDQSPKLLTDAQWPNGIYGDFSALRNERFMAELRQDFAEAVLRLVGEGMNEAARRNYLAQDPSVEAMRQRLRTLAAQPLIDCWASLAEADYRDVLARIDIPALLVHGGASNFYHPRTAHYVRDSTPSALLHIYDNVDHAPHLWERERFIEDVLAFVGAA